MVTNVLLTATRGVVRCKCSPGNENKNSKGSCGCSRLPEGWRFDLPLLIQKCYINAVTLYVVFFLNSFHVSRFGTT